MMNKQRNRGVEPDGEKIKSLRKALGPPPPSVRLE